MHAHEVSLEPPDAARSTLAIRPNYLPRHGSTMASRKRLFVLAKIFCVRFVQSAPLQFCLCSCSPLRSTHLYTVVPTLHCPDCVFRWTAFPRFCPSSCPICSYIFPLSCFNSGPQPVCTLICPRRIHDCANSACASIWCECLLVHHHVQGLQTPPPACIPRRAAWISARRSTSFRKHMVSAATPDKKGNFLPYGLRQSFWSEEISDPRLVHFFF